MVDGKPKGGGSTITMQTAKNLFLWSRPAILRKPFEIPLAAFMDLALGKSRVIEIYLNIVEWGPGVYGAEAAAQHHFGKSAANLTPQEAAQLAAALPNPKRRNAGNPGPRTMAFARRLRMKALRERGDSVCVLDADAERGEEAGDWQDPSSCPSPARGEGTPPQRARPAPSPLAGEGRGEGERRVT